MTEKHVTIGRVRFYRDRVVVRCFWKKCGYTCEGVSRSKTDVRADFARAGRRATIEFGCQRLSARLKAVQYARRWVKVKGLPKP